MIKSFREWDIRLSITAKQAAPVTVNDLKILAKMLYEKGDIESLQFHAMLVFQWHMH
jgi:hypothetical protein